MKKNNRVLAQEWFAIEKYLKGYLSFKGYPVRKVHLLRTLISQCIKFEPEFKKFEPQSNILDTYYIPPRYPVIPVTYSKEEAKKAIAIAEELIAFIKAKYKPATDGARNA